jgi:hypothetical protein
MRPDPQMVRPGSQKMELLEFAQVPVCWQPEGVFSRTGITGLEIPVVGEADQIVFNI